MDKIGTLYFKEHFTYALIVFLAYLLFYDKVWNVEKVEKELVHYTL